MGQSSGLATGEEINAPSEIFVPEAHRAQPRALGEALVSVRVQGDGPTRLDRLRQAGALKLVFPRPRGRGLDAVMVNTAGGVTGGDRFGLHAEAGPGAHLTLTTQAAERIYRAQPGETARITTTLSVAEGGRLNWLPQETILFERCALRRRLTIELATDARLLMAEPLILGRAAMGETLSDIRFHDRVEIRRNGNPLYLDGIALEGNAAARMARPATGAGAGTLASLVYVAPDAAAQLDALRVELPPTGGASLLGEDILVLRLLAPDSFLLRRTLVPILERLTDNALPTVWRL